MQRGIVYLLGAGPGDPELITLRARRRLAQADLVLYDALCHPDLLLYCRPDAERVFVGKRAGRTSERQTDINQRMLAAAKAGRVVARLKGGDPYLFGRGSEEAEMLASHGVAFEVVPGVPSALAATAYAGMSLSHRDLASSIAFITATESEAKDQSTHDWQKLATATQTLVIFMGVRKLASLMQRLIAHGRAADCPAAVVQSASLPSQRTVVGTVATIAERAEQAGVGMPALTIVGEVVRLRELLRWYDKQPLFGKRVLVTRPIEQAASMSQALRDAGAEPVIAPAIRIAPPQDAGALASAAAEVASYEWLVLTSQNAVHAFFAALHAQGHDTRSLLRARVAAIGSATAEALRSYGIKPDVMPEDFRSEALAAAIAAHYPGGFHGARFLLPCANLARDTLPELLRGMNGHVDMVSAYQTLPPDAEGLSHLRALFEERRIDIATFASASALYNTLDALGSAGPELLSRVTTATIGPVTAQAAQARGVRVDVSADPYTTEGLVAALILHFASRDTRS